MKTFMGLIGKARWALENSSKVNGEGQNGDDS